MLKVATKDNNVLSPSVSIMFHFIRGISAQLVLLGHLFSFMGFNYTLKIQNFGVIIFFIISGFIITFTILRKDNLSFGEYIFDRFFRIFISFLPAILFVLIIDYLNLKYFDIYSSVYGEAFNLKTFIGNLLMLQDFPIWNIVDGFRLTSFGSARPFWTVAIEWWIYLFFGFLILKRNRFNFLNFSILLVLAIVPLYNIGGRGNGLALMWLAGALAYVIHSKSKILKELKVFEYILLLTITLAGMMWAIYLNKGFYSVEFGILLSFFLLIAIEFKELHSWIKRDSFIARFSVRLASFSYSLYLLHYTIIVFCLNFWHNWEPAYSIIAGFVISNIISYLFATFTEFKYHNYRKFLKKIVFKIK